MNRACLQQGGIYVITDPLLIPDELLLPAVAAALRGGAGLVQYRNKQAAWPLRLRQAVQLGALCHAHEVPLIINDDIQLAAEAGADGVHLGRTDASPAQARSLLGASAIIGISGYADADAVEEPVADYVAFGRLFASNSKPTAPPAALDVLRQARQRSAKPLVGIGGINPGNAAQVLAAGADWLAVIQAVFGAADVEARTRQLCHILAQQI